MASLLALSFLSSLLTSCSDDEDRQETITKLRALGVSQVPVNAKPGDTVELTFYLSAPAASQVLASPGLDNDARYSVPVSVTPKDSNVVEANYGPLSLYSYRASVVVPQNAAIANQLKLLGFARVRSSVLFKIADTDQETIVSDTIVYAEGSAQLSWTAPTVDIVQPGATATSGTLGLEGAINNSGQETNRIAWFVSSGKVKNRRAKVTTWDDAASGSQSLFFTVRGSKSGAFAVKAANVNLSGN